AVLDQPSANAGRAPVRQLAIVVVRAAGIRVALDLDGYVGVELEKRLELLQRRLRALVVTQVGLVVLEVDDPLVVELALFQLDAPTGGSRRRRSRRWWRRLGGGAGRGGDLSRRLHAA